MAGKARKVDWRCREGLETSLAQLASFQTVKWRADGRAEGTGEGRWIKSLATFKSPHFLTGTSTAAEIGWSNC